MADSEFTEGGAHSSEPIWRVPHLTVDRIEMEEESGTEGGHVPPVPPTGFAYAKWGLSCFARRISRSEE